MWTSSVTLTIANFLILIKAICCYDFSIIGVFEQSCHGNVNKTASIDDMDTFDVNDIVKNVKNGLDSLDNVTIRFTQLDLCGYTTNSSWFENITKIEGNTTVLGVVLVMAKHLDTLENLTRYTEEKDIPLFVYNRQPGHSNHPNISTTHLNESKAMAELTLKLGWTYVQAVYQDSYKHILSEYKAHIGSHNVCVLKEHLVNENTTDVEFLEILDELVQEEETKGILLLLDELKTRAFFETRNNTLPKDLYFLSTSSVIKDWVYKDLEHVIQGTVTIAENMYTIKYEDLYRSTLLNYTETLDTKAQLDFVIESITMLLTALSESIHTDCVSNDNVSALSVERCIRSNSLTYLQNHTKTGVLNLQIQNGSYVWAKIADYNGSFLDYRTDIIFYDTKGAELKSTTSYSSPFRPECRPSMFGHLYSGPADAYIVGVLPVHATSRTPTGCGALNPTYAILSEAIAFGVDKLNKDHSILPNVKLGYIVLDSCGLSERVLVQFEKLYTGNLNKIISDIVGQKVIGTVGFPDDKVYLKLAPYLESKQLATISNFVSNPMLSDKREYPYFMRMVGSEGIQVGVMISVLRYLNISNIGMIYSNSASARLDVKKAFESIQKEGDILVNYQIRYDDAYVKNAKITDYLISSFVIKNLDNTRTVVVFAEPHHMKAIIDGAVRLNVSGILWIGGKNVFSETYKVLQTEHAIAIDLPMQSLKVFENHIEQLSGSFSLYQNIFVKEYFAMNSEYKNITNGSSDTDFIDETVYSGAAITTDSVSALARGFNTLISNVCSKKRFCLHVWKYINKLPELIQKNNFTGISGKKVMFNSKGDSVHVYSIMQYKGDSFIEVGKWENGILNISHSIHLPDGVTNRCKSDDQCFPSPSNTVDMTYVYHDGEPMLYGFLGIHEPDGKGTCSERINEAGFQIMYSILWSVIEINKDKNILPNTTLGVAIFDTCGLWGNTESLIKSVLKPSFIVPKGNVIPPTKTIVGIIGGEINPTAIAMEKATRQMNKDVPIFISSDTSVLNDQIRHPRVYRTVLPVTEEIDFLLSLLTRVKWTYVHVIYDDLSQGSIDYMEEKGRQLDICIATRSYSGFPMEAIFFDSAFENITLLPETTVVVLLIPRSFIRTALLTARNRGLSGKLYWIIPTETGAEEDIYYGLEDIALGLITIRRNVAVNTFFMNDFVSLRVDRNASLPWLPSYWQNYHQCNLRYTEKYNMSCTPEMMLNSTNEIKQDFNSAANINGVYALATAYDEILKQWKKSFQECFTGNMKSYYSKLEHALDNVKITPKGGAPFVFHNRNATIALSVMNLQRSPNGKVRFLQVGSFQNGRLSLDLKKTILYRNGKQQIEPSNCTGPCLQCMNTEFVTSYTNTVSILHSAGPPSGHKFTSASGVITILLNLIGFMLIGVVIYYLWGNIRHKAISLVLDANICILASSALVNVCSFAYLFNTSDIVCAVQRAIPGCVFTLPLGCLLVKLNKSICLRDIVGQKQIQVPRWDFAITYLPMMMASPLVVYLAWLTQDQNFVTWTVPDIHDITTIDDVNIVWTCTINRNGFLTSFMISWELVLQTVILGIAYFARHSKQPEVKQVTYSSVLILLTILIWCCVLFLSEDYDSFSMLICGSLPVIGILLVIFNFLPFIIILIHEEQREAAFSQVVWKQKTRNMFTKWRRDSDEDILELEARDNSKIAVDVTSSKPSSNQTAKKMFNKWKRDDKSNKMLTRRQTQEKDDQEDVQLYQINSEKRKDNSMGMDNAGMT